jgi:hypothetical protein
MTTNHAFIVNIQRSAAKQQRTPPGMSHRASQRRITSYDIPTTTIEAIRTLQVDVVEVASIRATKETMAED